MDVEQPGRHRLSADAPPVDWPARTRRLVDEIRLLCRDWLSAPLRVCLADFDRALHDRAANTRSHIEQQRYQATRQRVVQERQAFEQRFIECVDRGLLQLGSQPVAAKAPPARLTLSLLDPLEHEMTAALDQLVARSAARGGPLLVELSYRLAVLIGMPPLESESMPLGPQAMARAFRDSSAALGLPAEHHLLLLQAVEGRLIEGLTPLHEMVNDHLAAAGILPRLRPFPLPRSPRQPRRPRPLPPAAAPEPAATSARAAGLRELLVRQRGPRPVSGHARFASGDELLAALVALQHQPGRNAEGGLLRRAQRLREALVDQLNAGQPIDAIPILPGPDADDALELSVRLFDTLHQQLPPSTPAHGLLDRVQWSMLRAAVADGSFFERRDHPARLLLEQLLQAARDWLEGGDNALVAPLEPLLDRLDREPPTATLHAELRAELERQVGQLQRKAQLAERRHVEAMQGRERLEQARQRANELLAGLLAKAPPRAALRALLEHAWSDVLALTLLRHGEQSETFARRLVITDQLLGRLPPGNLETLQAEVVAGLQQIGMHGEEASAIAQRLIGAGAVMQDADAPGLTGLALRLKQRQTAGDTAVPADAAPVLSAEALRLHQRLRQHAGVWFEFTEPDGGRARRKLAWYSPRAARGLFVTRQGQRAEEMSLAELAQAIGAGKVREVPAVNESDLDRAWRALTDSLRQPSPMPGARS
ncbi:DUF1631 family protein [Frateuria hangzhouensis]|uniref:DUF1631 family protein n=1 Tax=Frateuria hangzhouensis TaxID=2995589 RepID=UPI00226083B8|nr:DUF1631 family protein [Frateuria sp. STR12]MCX7515104.1 DUF1631 family protein [Frateuria sp. STR12]